MLPPELLYLVSAVAIPWVPWWEINIPTMTKQRKYLYSLIPISINRIVNYDGSFEYQFDGNALSLVPESHGKRCFLSVFVNGVRQPMQWALSSQPHKGKLRNGAIIGY